MNIRPYLIINGVNSQSIQGLLVSELAPISKPQQRTQIDEVDGRDGDIVTPLGFAAYDKRVKIGLSYDYDIDDIIEFFNSSGVVTFSNEPDKYYRFAIYEQIDFERLIRFKTAEVTLHCQPFKFSTTETPKLFNVTSGSPITVKNDGNYQSRPNLTIIGSGDVDLSLNGSQVLSLDLEDNQAIIIDTEDMNAYAAQTAIKEVIAEINPVQDLHGQEYPYPAGGGKNKLDPSLLLDQAAWNTITITLSPNTTYIMSTNMPNDTNLSLFFFNSTGNPSSGNVVYQGHNILATTNEDGIVKIQQRRVSGSDSFQNYQWQVEQGSTATAYAPYENICPITGFTESNVTLFGANVWGGETMADDCVNAVNNTSYCNKSTDEIGDYVSLVASYAIGVPFFSTFKANTRYTIRLKVSKEGNPANKTTNMEILYTDGTSTFLNAPTNFSVNNVQEYVIVSSANKTIECIRGNYYSGTARFYYDDCGVMEGVHTIDDFVPYLGSEYTIVFEDDQGDPITAYKGRINFTTGVLTLDGKIVDLGSLNWNYVSSGNRFNSTGISSIVKAPVSDSTVANIISSALATMSLTQLRSSTRDGLIAIGDTGNISVRYINAGTDAALFKTAITGVQLVYDLKTPIEIQLTPTIINNLLGLNQMYADNNGDISVTFSSDGVIRTETGDIVSFNVAVEDMQKGILLNRLVIGDYDKIRLSKGNNTIVLSGGAQQFVIDKYSRWL